jgi:hypothetical protein
MLAGLTRFAKSMIERRPTVFWVTLLAAVFLLTFPTALVIAELVTRPGRWWLWSPLLAVLVVPWFILVYLSLRAQEHALWLFLHRRG